MDEYLMSFIAGGFYSNWIIFSEKVGITISAFIFIRNNKK